MAKADVQRCGFTLVELLIVITILGIVAAIVVPRYSASAEDSRLVAAREQVRQISNAIELYKTEHEGRLPDLLKGWQPLLSAGTFRGKSVGPYLMLTPLNPLNGLSNVRDATPADVASGRQKCGFIYDYKRGAGSGRIVATDADGLTALKD